MTRGVISVITAVIIALTAPVSVFANAVDESFYSANDILYYDPNACAPGTAGGTGSMAVEGNDNLEQLLRFFTGKGLSLAAAAGIAGNIKQESGWNPAIIQGGQIAPDNYTPVNGVGFGLAQWTFTARQKPLMDFARSHNAKITDMGMQLNFMWQELTTSYKESTLARMDAEKTDPARAAWIFHKYYEGSADSEAQVRAGRGVPAVAIYEKYKGTIPDGTGVAIGGVATPTTPDNAYSQPANNVACSADAGTSTNGSGDTSVATSVTSDGFAVYSQYDPRWADSVIQRDTGGTTTLAISGCGPTSMAMIINKLTGKSVDMKQIVKQTNDLGLITAGGGYNNLSTKLAPLYGLKSKSISLSVAAINAALKNGSMIHIVGRGSAPFTTGGHFVTIRGIATNGNWLVGDSNGQKGIDNSNNMSGFSPAALLSDASAAYEVSK
jgi:hypothetical protein